MDFLRSGLRPSLRKSTVFYHKVTAILILFQLAIAICDKIILENLKALSDAGSKIILRCPIIPGFNDRAEHFKGISETAEKFIGIEHIEIEPFHPLGESKYSALGRGVADIPVPSGKTVDKWIKQIGCGTDKDVICAYQA